MKTNLITDDEIDDFITRNLTTIANHAIRLLSPKELRELETNLVLVAVLLAADLEEQLDTVVAILGTPAKEAEALEAIIEELGISPNL